MKCIDIKIYNNTRILTAIIFIILVFLSSCTQLSGSNLSNNVLTKTAVSNINSFQIYNNQKEHYSISVPSEWAISTSDVGTTYFLNEQSLVLRNKGLTDWESSVGGIQFVGRNEQLSGDAQFNSILPNHCLVETWNEMQINGVVGRRYSLNCDSTTASGMQQRDHIFIPRGSRFIELWIRSDAVTSGSTDGLISKLVSSLRFES